MLLRTICSVSLVPYCFACFALFLLAPFSFARSVLLQLLRSISPVPFYFARFTQFRSSLSIEFAPLSVAFLYCSVVFIPLFCSVAIVLFVLLRLFRFVLWQWAVLLVSLLVSVVNRLSDSKCRIHSPLLDMELCVHSLNKI